MNETTPPQPETRETASPVVETSAPPGRLREAFALLRRDPRALAGLVLVCLLGLTALLGPVMAPFPFWDADDGNEHVAPGWPHVMGTDWLARDIFSRLLYGARISFGVRTRSLG